MSFGKPFEKGQGGRVKGARNKLSMAFVEALAAEFAEFGAEAIRIARIERPTEFIKIIASIMPKEFEIVDNRLAAITDEELNVFIEYAQRQLAGGLTANIESREGPTIDGESTRLLPTIRETT
jgi:hypothetical protein